MSALSIAGPPVARELKANATASTPAALGAEIARPGSVLIHAATSTPLDLTNEGLGDQGAKWTVYAAFAANALRAGYAHRVGALTRKPNSSWNGVPPALVAAPRVVAASPAACLRASLAGARTSARCLGGRGPGQ